MNHGEANISMGRDKQYGSESDMDGAARVEKGVTYIGGEATDVTD